MSRIDVLDKGYVRLVDHMGSDLTVVNAARASYMKESHELTDRDRRLIRFLAEHGHTSPFRHAWVQLEIKAPLMVARQWWKHVVGSASLEEGSNWNEASRRYVTLEPVFYVPTEWRRAPEHRKQGSDGQLDPGHSSMLHDLLDAHVRLSALLYEKAMDLGAAAEQARLFLPAYALYTVWRWTASLHAIAHFIRLRREHDAQWEIRQYAEAVYQLVRPLYPESIAALLGGGEAEHTA